MTPVNVQIPPGAAANSSTSGCAAGDFTGFPAGHIALMQRGTCTFREKVDNAAAAGAIGAIIFNEGQEGRTETLLGTLSPPQAAIPAVGTSFAIGEEIYNLIQEGAVTARLAVFAEVREATTENVLAETTTGRTTAPSWWVDTSTRFSKARASRTTAPEQRPFSRSRCRWPSSGSNRGTGFGSPSGAPKSRA